MWHIKWVFGIRSQQAFKTALILCQLSLLWSTRLVLPAYSEEASELTIQNPTLTQQFPHLAQAEIQLIEAINKIRIEHQLEPLKINQNLIAVARFYSQYMAEKNCFKHNCPGFNMKQALEKTGNPFLQWSENLSTGFLPGNMVIQSVQMWVNDPHHLQNILVPELSETGIGVWVQGNQYYVTQVMIQPDTQRAIAAQSSGTAPAAQPPQTLTREAFEAQIQKLSPDQAIQLTERFWLQEFQEQLDPQNVTNAAHLISTEAISAQLRSLELQTQQRVAVIYAVALKDQLQLFGVLPSSDTPKASTPVQLASTRLTGDLITRKQKAEIINRVLEGVSKEKLLHITRKLRVEIRDPRKVGTTSYIEPAEQLYDYLIAPLEAELKARKINTLLFALDDGLRSLPIAALYGHNRFLIEDYSLALIPSFGLTNTQSTNVKKQNILAMGISESTQGQFPLPGVSVEIRSIPSETWPKTVDRKLNGESTLDNFKSLILQQPYGIIHLATHAEFNPGRIRNSYIQFWNQKLTLEQLAALSRIFKWNIASSVELLVLSACQTAIGSREAELGFSGVALQAGVKSTLASLWSINDQATVGLMLNFYRHLSEKPSKVEALRQAQLAMLKGEVQLVNGNLILSPRYKISWPDRSTQQDFSHPYFWSAYVIVGNWR